MRNAAISYMANCFAHPDNFMIPLCNVNTVLENYYEETNLDDYMG